MCGMCKAEESFASLEKRAEQARVNDDRRGLRQIAQELEMVFFNVEAEERENEDFAQNEPIMRDRFDRIRRVIVGGENPASVFSDLEDGPEIHAFTAGSPEDLIEQIRAAMGGQKEAPAEPSLDDWLMAANVDVEKVLLRVSPMIRFAKELRTKLEEEGGFSPAAAEQMAAAAFMATIPGVASR